MFVLWKERTNSYHVHSYRDGFYAKPIENCWNLKVFKTVEEAEHARKGHWDLKYFQILPYTDELKQAHLQARLTLKPMFREYPVDLRWYREDH